MPDGTAKKRRYVFNYGRLKLFIIVVVLIYTLAALAGQQETLAKQIQRQEELTKSQAELEQQIEYYANELDYIGTDEYVEQEARTRFGWLMPGEVKYVEGNSSTPAASPSPSAAGGAAATQRPAASSSPAAASASAASSETAAPSASGSAAASEEATAVPTSESGETLSPEMANNLAHASASQAAAED